jgi:hypothetical protein
MRGMIWKRLKPIDVSEVILWVIVLDILLVMLFPHLIVHSYPRI